MFSGGLLFILLARHNLKKGKAVIGGGRDRSGHTRGTSIYTKKDTPLLFYFFVLIQGLFGIIFLVMSVAFLIMILKR